MAASIGLPGVLLLLAAFGDPAAGVVSHGVVAANFASMTALAEVHQ
jgi:hypothetical protein